MKKLAIAGASAVLAAMPVVGVFAATEGSFTDDITVTVQGGCTIQVAGGTAGQYADRTFSATVAAGTAEILTGVEGASSTTPASAMNVTCNTSTASSFKITATATNSGALKGETNASNLINPGTADSGNTSSFSYRINDGAWAAVPDTATEVFTGTASSTTPATFNPTYRVYVAPGQAPDTYKGSVTYTVALGA